MHFRLYWDPGWTVLQILSPGVEKVANIDFFLDRTAGIRETEGKLPWHELPVAADRCRYHRRHIAIFGIVFQTLLLRFFLTAPVQ